MVHYVIVLSPNIINERPQKSFSVVTNLLLRVTESSIYAPGYPNKWHLVTYCIHFTNRSPMFPNMLCHPIVGNSDVSPYMLGLNLEQQI